MCIWRAHHNNTIKDHMYLLTSLSLLSFSLAVCSLLLSIRMENNGKNYPGIGSVHTTRNKRRATHMARKTCMYTGRNKRAI